VVTQVKDDTGPYLQSCLREVFGNHPLVGDIQGTGWWRHCSSPKTRPPASACQRERHRLALPHHWFREGPDHSFDAGPMIMAPH
jgi:hypothetical protein